MFKTESANRFEVSVSTVLGVVGTAILPGGTTLRIRQLLDKLDSGNSIPDGLKINRKDGWVHLHPS